jgi:hypothetical protein
MVRHEMNLFGLAYNSGLINAIWQAPLEGLTIGQDLPRLGVKHEIRLQNEIVFNHDMFMAQKVINAVGFRETEDESTKEVVFDAEHHSDFIEHLIRLLFEYVFVKFCHFL